MSYHECPIEPPDWSDGPHYYDEGNCRDCDGTGEVIDDRDQEQTCPYCGGSGFVDQECFDDDYCDFDRNYDANDGTEGSG